MNEVIYKMGELFSGPGGIAYGAIHACFELNVPVFSFAGHLLAIATFLLLRYFCTSIKRQ